MSKKIISGITVILIMTSALSRAPAEEEKPRMGLTVQPGGMLVQRVPLGETYDFYESVGIPLTIHNRDMSPHTYTLSTDKPSKVAAGKWLMGYSEIPDPSWFRFEEDEVTIEPNSKREVKMYLKIPDEEKYYNQRWTVALGVKGKAEPGMMLALAAYPRVQIETLSKYNVKEPPYGSIAAVPGTLSFENPALGKKIKKKIKIYNNGPKRRRYKIRSKVFPANPKKEKIHVSQGYSWIPDPKWVRPGKNSMTIKSGESRELTVSVKVPDDKENYNRKWEAILFIESKKALPGFARIQIETGKMKKNEK